MNRRHLAAAATLVAVAFPLAACTGDRTVPGVASTPTSAGDSSSGASTLPHHGAPKVQDPLPGKVLEGNPCDSALTPTQVKEFIGDSDPATRADDALGTACRWRNAPGTGAAFTVGYETKNTEGLSLSYKTIKPTAARWEEPAPVQGYPAIAYVPDGITAADKRLCSVVVGVSDQLSYSVTMTLGDAATAAHVDGCTAARDVADAVMTNVKARA
ncbi:DUF3558 domain-containing protein [Amycolatopsis sp. H20-H5]|uniref:DUF3558 domain-containing protein n=1 Tax=Amycolatopsis sp. H20-H5 TaxID=3046309 RepID=UPI002DB8BAA9|nr:DUF3558 domain-containing protein [Amycolatopsis sp. H20-H5]MEC3974655.1 DUF3558 domain-containing protein [Amycolatopsis sp. H20-H5]